MFLGSFRTPGVSTAKILSVCYRCIWLTAVKLSTFSPCSPSAVVFPCPLCQTSQASKGRRKRIAPFRNCSSDRLFSNRQVSRKGRIVIYLKEVSIVMGLKRTPPDGNVRRVVSLGLNLRGVITSKAGRTVQFESFAERVLLLLLERDQSVIDYRSQPETFDFTDRNGTPRKYTPDFIVWRQSGAIEIHEVTRTERQSHSNIIEREYGARCICQKRHWQYIVHTEQTLPQPTVVANLLALWPYRLKKYGQESITAAIREYLDQYGPFLLTTCVKDVAQRLNMSEPMVFPTFCHLLWKGDIAADLHSLLIVECAFDPKATIWLPSREEKEQ